ncbi:MAG TPA: phage/plasmid primase, P4 family [Stellaceae bacterium]
MWDNDPLDVPVGTITLAQLQALMQALSLALHGEAAPIAGKATRSDNALYHPPMQCSIEQLDRVLAILPNDTVFFEPYERFEAMGFGIAGATGKSAAGRQRWIDWCGQVFQEQENKPEDFWASIENPRFGYPRLLKLAFERAPEEALALVQEESRFAFADDLDQATIATGAEAAEEAARVQDDLVAEAFAASVAGGMRYVAVSGKWLEWRSAHWVEDAILRVNSLARRTCRRERVKRTSMATMVNKVLALAKADPRLAATADQWDRNDWLLNTPGGSVDLKTGVMRPHDREDYCTKMTAVTPQGDCPLFKAFLRRILNDDAELIAFVKRTIGYCLTGDTSEQVILFNHGLGQNGKTVLMSTIAGMLGSYCLSASIETFTESRSDRHPTELARLQGARLVIATETEANRYWAESRLKELTGGERITARYMHKDFFTFQPKFKPWISGNHRPRLHSIGQAMRRRVFLIPFEVTIPDKDRDFGLTEKLKAEWPGILAWAIEGCLEFQAVGLQPARAVVQATDAYFSEEDAYANWLMECCEIDYSSQVQSMALFSSWSDWAEHNQRPRDSLKRFYAEMGRLGHIPTHVRTGSVFKGLRIKLSFEV